MKPWTKQLVFVSFLLLLAGAVLAIPALEKINPAHLTAVVLGVYLLGLVVILTHPKYKADHKALRVLLRPGLCAAVLAVALGGWIEAGGHGLINHDLAVLGMGIFLGAIVLSLVVAFYKLIFETD